MRVTTDALLQEELAFLESSQFHSVCYEWFRSIWALREILRNALTWCNGDADDKGDEGDEGGGQGRKLDVQGYIFTDRCVGRRCPAKQQISLPIQPYEQAEPNISLESSCDIVDWTTTKVLKDNIFNITWSQKLNNINLCLR